MYDADKLYWEMIAHDDGVDARGGVTGLISGEMGSGKSTMLLQTAQATKHAPRGMDIRTATQLGKLIRKQWYGEAEVWTIGAP